MLDKTTNLVDGTGIVGFVCVTQPEPPRPQPPTQPDVPRPPKPFVKPPAPPESDVPTVRIYTYQDSEGRCWRVSEWSRAAQFIRIEKTQINCSEL